MGSIIHIPPPSGLCVSGTERHPGNIHSMPAVNSIDGLCSVDTVREVHKGTMCLPVEPVTSIVIVLGTNDILQHNHGRR